MSDITPAKEKIQQESVEFEASTSEFAMKIMGGSINWILNKIDTDLSNYSLKTQTFVSSGTFTPPADVTFVYVIGCGGGSGGIQTSNSGGFSSYAYFGGNGAAIITDLFTVTPSTLINVIIGSGGAYGNNGGDSSFDTKIFPGAKLNEIGIIPPGDDYYYYYPIYKNHVGSSTGGFFSDRPYLSMNLYRSYGQDAYGYLGGQVNGGGGAGPFGNGGTTSVNGSGYGAGGSYNSGGSGGIIKVMYFTKY